MSEQRSWDSRQHFRVPDCAGPHGTGKPVRMVEWDPEWPPREEVPQRGTRWLDRESDEVELVVLHGLPWRDADGEWRVDVDEGRDEPTSIVISDLKPIPPKPETASGEVVGEIRMYEDGTFSYETGGSRARRASGTKLAVPAGTYKLIRTEPKP